MTARYLYAFDPSTKATGIALFADGILEHVCVLEAKSVDTMLERVRRWVESVPPGADCVVEVPQTYPRSPVNPKSLLMITQIAGAIRAHFPTSKAYLPKEWNHGRPKKVTEERIKRLLTPREIAMVEEIRPAIRNNAWDAVGLGLFHLGRLK